MGLFSKKDFFSEIKLKDSVSKEYVKDKQLLSFLSKIESSGIESVTLNVHHGGVLFIKSSNFFTLKGDWFIVDDLGVFLTSSVLDKINFSMDENLIKVEYESSNNYSRTIADIEIKLK